MLKQIVKLALAALIANAAWRVGSEYVTHFRFRDAVRAAIIAAGPDDAPLRGAIMREADRLALPLTVDTLTVARVERRVSVAGSYRRDIALLPGYQYPWTFNWEVEAFVVPSVGDLPPH